ncbi:hypothetical protein B296_00050612 [Ensete ventricosum]|uniref:Uncharacterized protein n=1 Tax=Ensete ventricosum TaxID=4639 RepID=A0A426WW34_ENSVE|nr:hypothetical protein B296_00050612 [Ensete ventricosum]
MATNTPSSVYSPCMSTESFELAISLTSVSFAQLFRSLRNTSHFARSHLSLSAPLCLKHYQVWLPTVGHYSECQAKIPAPLSDFFSYISMSISPKRLHVLVVLHTAQLGPPRLYGVRHQCGSVRKGQPSPRSPRVP